MKIGILGVGKMGEAIIRGLKLNSDAKRFEIQGTTRSVETARDISIRYGINCHNDNRKLVNQNEVIILCIKPKQANEVLSQISRQFTKNHLVISVCAAISRDQISKWIRHKSEVVRVMPNTPCLIGEGMSVFSLGGLRESKRGKAIVEKIFGAMGKTALIEEELMDGATGLSGCGPAYGYLIIEALSEAGVKVGLSRGVSVLLAAQTLLGSAKMCIERKVHPAALKDEVTTPAGCTIDGLMALEEGKLRVTLIKAVLAAARKSKKLGPVKK